MNSLISLTSPYRYEPLLSHDSIRLVHIHAGDSAADIQVTIVQTRLKQAPKYEAISYTWGDGKTSSVDQAGKHSS